MAGGNDGVVNFEDDLTPEERQRYRSRVREIIAESALMTEVRRRKRLKAFLVRALAQMHAQMEMMRIRGAAEMKKLDDAADRKALQAQIRYLDGALRRSVKVLGLQ